MKKSILFFIMAVSFATLGALPSVTVTGARVSLRAEPKENAELLGRAEINEKLSLIDDSNSKWVGVVPPDRVDLWVNNEYLENDSVVPERLNVRSGPSLGHSVVGVVSRGDTVDVRSTLHDWVRIAPPEGTVAWISRDYVLFPEPESKLEPKIEVEPDLAEKEPEAELSSEEPKVNSEVAEVVEQVAVIESKTVAEAEDEPSLDAAIAPTNDEEIVAISEEVTQPSEEETVLIVQKAIETAPATENVSEHSVVLVPDKEKEQGVMGKYSGLLRPEDALLYKIVDLENDKEMVCYVRGNLDQMKEFTDCEMRITGKTYWIANEENLMIVPERIEIISFATTE